MIIKITDYKDKTFTIIDNNVIRDTRISLTARGLLSYMLSCSNTWTFTIESLCKQTNTKQAKLLTALKELTIAGYLKKEINRDAQGKIKGFNWIVSEIPNLYEDEPF